MIYTELNASGYNHNGVFYNAEFERLLSKIIAGYKLMLVDKVILNNDENSIRDVFLINYLKNNSVRKRIEMTDYLFDREVPEDRSRGRTDIKVQTLNTFQDTSAYYIIECKRLDAKNRSGLTGLNAKYIEKGIYRFASKAYSIFYKTNGMIGFVIEALDIDENVISINTLLRTTFTHANLTHELRYTQITSGFQFSYYSKHSVDGNDVGIYHLMFDFSGNIQ